ncbi:MAG: hypothetical protein ACW976_05570, partial [Candidatus Ranarchaeia archaeon]
MPPARPSLDRYLDSPSQKKEKTLPATPEKPKSAKGKAASAERLEQIRTQLQTLEAPSDSPDAVLLSIDYDGNRALAKAKLLDPKTQNIFFWWDNTGHLPYFLTDLSQKEVEQISTIRNHPGYSGMESIELLDLLHDKKVTMTKIIAKDPLSVGGSSGAMRDEVPTTDTGLMRAWEARIRYRQTYTMDRKLIPGLLYHIKQGNLLPTHQKVTPTQKQPILKAFQNEPQEVKDRLEAYLPLLFTPLPKIHRLALDIEVEV